MKKIFAPGGIFASRFTEYEYRPQQLTLAQEISDFLGSDDTLFAAEAPTGIGKTWAMLAPSMLWANKAGKTILVLTSGITLQEQLIYKDIPALLDALDLDLTYGLLKGRRNYACIRKAKEIGAEGYLDFAGDHGEAAKDILSWLYDTETGDMSELSLPDDHPARARIESSHYTCLGPLCPHYEHCFYTRALREAMNCRVLVANYHVYFSYVLAQRRAFPVACDLIICDEAHKMPEAAQSVTRVTVDARDWQRLARRAPRLERVDPALLRGADCPASAFAASVADLSGLTESLFAQIQAVLPEGAYTKYPESLKNDALSAITKCSDLSGALDRIKATDDDGGSLGDEMTGELNIWKAQLDEASSALRWCCEVDQYPQWAYWREGDTLNSASVSAAGVLPDAFPIETKVIALSATMTVEGSFDYWITETGLEPDRQLILDSPFDLLHHMQIDVIDLRLRVTDREYPARVAKVCRSCARSNGGATLILLASRRLLRTVSTYLNACAKQDRLTIFTQGEHPRTELLDLFRTTPRSVLVGMASFREGIDVPGDALTQVIIDRIPFPHPSDPINQARAELEGSRHFMKVLLPRAKMQLRQAAGRLIRTATDHGRVVILDNRVTSRPAWRVLASLPQVPVNRYRVVDSSSR